MKININVNDKFLIKHGANHHGHGTALFVVKRITKQGNVYGEKWHKSKDILINNNYKLEYDYILGRNFNESKPIN